MIPKSARFSHGTVAAYLALFVALGGTSWAATQSGVDVASVARGKPSVKIRCSAKSAGKKIACKVVKGSGVGPRGPQGPPGPPGSSGSLGSLGSTVLTEPPGFSIESGGNIDFQGGGGSFSAGNEEQGWTATSTALGQNTTQSVFQSYLLSPSELSGSKVELSSVQFCYGAFANTNKAYTGKAAIEITNATVDEYDEPESTGTAPVGAPPYSQPTALIDSSFTPSLTGGFGCQALTPVSPQTVTSGGYLVLYVTVSFPNAGYLQPGPSDYQYSSAPLYFARITTTYTP